MSLSQLLVVNRPREEVLTSGNLPNGNKQEFICELSNRTEQEALTEENLPSSSLDIPIYQEERPVIKEIDLVLHLLLQDLLHVTHIGLGNTLQAIG